MNKLNESQFNAYPRQQKQLHLDPEKHAPKWRLVECNDGGARLNNNGACMVRSQRVVRCQNCSYLIS